MNKSSEYPISDVVFQYHFETEHLSNGIEWNASDDSIRSYCDRTAETYHKTQLFRMGLSDLDKFLFAELMGIAWAYSVLPHGQEIHELYPILCSYETISKKTTALALEKPVISSQFEQDDENES